MELLKKNLESLPELEEIVDKIKTLEYPVEETRNGQVTIKIENIYMHSKYDPLKESTKIVDMLLSDNEEPDVLIVFGWGLGYVVKGIYERLIKDSDKKIIPYLLIIEKDFNLFLTSLAHLDYSGMLKNANVKIFLDSEKETIGSFLQSIPTKRIRYYNHRPSYIIHQDYYKEVQSYLVYVLNRKDMNNATFKRFQKLWMKNMVANLPYYLGSNTLNELRDTATGLTTIVVAGGPTLDRAIDFLLNSMDNAIIIAVDTVCKKLIDNGIIPDIIATIDPQYWNYKFLENVNTNDSIIITDASVYYKVFQLTKPERYFTGNSIFPLIKYFDGSDRGTLGAGGSVATIAFDTARIIGTDEIILIGLDLSFPERKTHFHGAFFENNFLSISNFFKPAEDHSYNYLVHVGLETADSTNGKVLSDARMLLFKKWFDREIQLTRSAVILPDLGGVKLDGSIIKKLGDIKIKSSADKKGFIEKINRIINRNSQIDVAELYDRINNFINYANEIKLIYKKIISLISEDGKVAPDCQKTIEENEKVIQSDVRLLGVLKILSSSSQDMIINILENFSYNDNEKQSGWIKTRLLYKSIIESIESHEIYLKKLLNKSGNFPNIINREW